MIPENAIGIISVYNDEPLWALEASEPVKLTSIVSKSENVMKLEQAEEFEHGLAYYLGAIVSEDRNTVYWQNTTRPLPAGN